VTGDAQQMLKLANGYAEEIEEIKTENTRLRMSNSELVFILFNKLVETNPQLYKVKYVSRFNVSQFAKKCLGFNIKSIFK
jgi:hypothetical protein